MSDQTVSNLARPRILDFSWVLAGPYATRLLADFGMEVIKVQPFLPESAETFSRAYYHTWNRNKLGISLNLGKPEGLELARRLVRVSDAVVENFSPRVMANWGLDYPAIEKLKDDIILVSLSVMGHTGTQKDYVGYGPTAQAFSGITTQIGYPGQPPSGIGYSYADHIAALYASLALLGALEYRRKTGLGQYIDLSETEALISLFPEPIIDYTLNGVISQLQCHHSRFFSPFGVYPCRGDDRWCAISITTEPEWANFKRALGNPVWAEDPCFATLPKRLQKHEELTSLIQAWTAQHTAEEILTLLQKEGVPASIVQNAADLVRDPHLNNRAFFHASPLIGKAKILNDACPIRLEDNPASYHKPAPQHGQDNFYVLHQLLGLTQTEIDRLIEQNII